jgi:hypothetical protein
VRRFLSGSLYRLAAVCCQLADQLDPPKGETVDLCEGLGDVLASSFDAGYERGLVDAYRSGVN